MLRADPKTKQEREILGQALEALTRTTGLQAKRLVHEPRTKRGRLDAEILIKKDAQRHRYLVEVKPFVDRTVALNAVKEHLRPFGQKAVLVTPYLTTELANYCRETLDLQFIDAAGNAYLQGRGLYIFVRGERATNAAGVIRPAATKAKGTATGLRVIFALLCKPELLNAPYRDIARAAGVALGTVGWVFYDLETRRLTVGGRRKGGRRFVEPERIFNEWVVNYPIKLRPKLMTRTFKAADPGWWQRAQLKPFDAVWGGEVAADRITEYREPGRCTVYIDPEKMGRFIVEHRLRADPEGDIEFIEKFWNFEYDKFGADVAPPIVIYADLLATPDPRNHQTARLIYEKHLINALRQTG